MHACRIGNDVRIGIGAVVLTGAIVEDGAQVGAGALVPQGKVVPAGWLVMGVPAKPVRQMGPEEIEDIKRNAVEYFDLWQRDYRFGPQGAPGSTPRAPNSPVSGKPMFPGKPAR